MARSKDDGKRKSHTTVAQEEDGKDDGKRKSHTTVAQDNKKHFKKR